MERSVYQFGGNLTTLARFDKRKLGKPICQHFPLPATCVSELVCCSVLPDRSPNSFMGVEKRKAVTPRIGMTALKDWLIV